MGDYYLGDIYLLWNSLGPEWVYGLQVRLQGWNMGFHHLGYQWKPLKPQFMLSRIPHLSCYFHHLWQWAIAWCGTSMDWLKGGDKLWGNPVFFFLIKLPICWVKLRIADVPNSTISGNSRHTRTRYMAIGQNLIPWTFIPPKCFKV